MERKLHAPMYQPINYILVDIPAFELHFYDYLRKFNMYHIMGLVERRLWILTGQMRIGHTGSVFEIS